MEKVRCPACKEWASWKDNPHRPFCSEACKNKDLGKWANEEYRVPVQEEQPDLLKQSKPRASEDDD